MNRTTLKYITVTVIMTLGAFAGVVSCKKDPCKGINCNSGTCSGGTCSCPSGYTGDRCQTQETGTVSFWTDVYGSDITVSCNGSSGIISEYYVNNPGCSATGCATFSLPVGTYNYTATNGSLNWSGSVTSSYNQCYTEELITSSSETGTVTFWTDLNYGAITVNCNGSSGTVTEYYPGGNPGCNAAGCVTFTLPVGSYNFTATNGSLVWSGTVTSTYGGCYTWEME